MMTAFSGISASGATIETVEDFATWVATYQEQGIVTKKSGYKLAKHQPFFQSYPKYGRARKIKKISLSVKTRLCEALILPTLLYSAELWPVSVTQMKKLEAAHHRWQRSILGIFWKDKVTTEKVREATALPKLGDIITCRRLRWLGYLSRMECHRIRRQAHH